MHLPLMMRDNILPAYANATGGNFDGEFRQGGIEKSFAKIAEEVRTQYTIGYYTHEPFIDGKYRQVEVKVLRPNLTVLAKKGYYPTAQDAKPPSGYADGQVDLRWPAEAGSEFDGDAVARKCAAGAGGGGVVGWWGFFRRHGREDARAARWVRRCG